ncbi:unnamed protein product [Hymenolepis diminuta]|uniref:Uncharacterized protein n=1 Tax=Hymenolepis diminuta TaxID=6216 RepID=A0A564Y1F9_HYMDI|nr:unnamed protein product [Hymenolepis diminuta]
MYKYPLAAPRGIRSFMEALLDATLSYAHAGANIGAGIGSGEIGSSAMEAVSRQPEATVESELEETGSVIQSGDGVVRIHDVNNVQAGELLSFSNGCQCLALNLEENRVGAVILGNANAIREGDIATRTKRIAPIQVGDGLLGHVINALGEPIDGKGPITGERFEMPLERNSLGIKAIDAMIPIGKGQRELIIGDRQSGKTSIAINTIINQGNLFEQETLRRYGAMDYTTTVVASSAYSAPTQSFAPFAGVAIDSQVFPETNLFNAGIKPAVNVRISVSGIGGFGQIPRMKKVASTCKLEQAQFAALEATSKKSLDRGRKNQDLFKQSLHDPMVVEKQIALLYIAISGYLGTIPPDQGDVGSGKTTVASLAMLLAIGSGAQAAVMAPTETVAEQHHVRLHSFA